jgi:hypothetical protein
MKHKDALKLVFPNHKKGQNYSCDIEDKFRTFLKLGTKVKGHFKKDGVESFAQFKHPTVIRIRWKGTERYHAVVYDPVSRRVFDPWYKNLPKSLYVRNFECGYELLNY